MRRLVPLLISVLVAGCGSDDSSSGGADGGTGGSSSGGAANGGSGNTSGSGGSGNGAGTGGSGASSSGAPTIGSFIGLDGFIDDPVDKLAAIGNVREYHQWSWNDGNGVAGYPGYPDNALEFSLWGGFWDFDDYYTKLGQAGVMVFPDINGTVDWLGNAVPPVSNGGAPDDPQSYVAHASFMYQYAARYALVQVPEGALKLADGQTKKTGLGLLQYFEDDNEPDNNWTLPAGAPLFAPEHYAAMASADYDGHQGALGTSFGVKAADPLAKLVLAGLAGAGPANDWVTDTTAYLDGIRAWSDTNRGGSFPADVINVHYYCFGASQFGDPDPVPAVAPEACKLKELLGKIVEYRDQHLPGKELWLTEFGYDTHPKSRLRAPAIGSKSAEVVQAEWLVRSFLELMGSGIDRAFLFVSRDGCTGDDTKCPDNDIQFATSGVLTEKGEENGKPSFYYIATLRSRLASMQYAGTAESGDANVSIVKLVDPTTKKGAYVVWAPTSDGTTVDAYSLAVASAATSASIVTLADQSTTGNETSASVSAGKVTVDVSETPTLVLIDAEP